MKCSKCQHQLPKNSQVCNRCGAIQATTSAYWKEGKGSNRTLPALLLIGFGLLLLLSLAVGQLLTSGTLSNSVSEEEEETAGFLGFECRSEAIGEHVRDLHAEDLDSAAILIRIRAQEIDDLELLICEDEEGSPVFTSWELEDYEAYVEVLMEVACQPVSAGDSANRIGSPGEVRNSIEARTLAAGRAVYDTPYSTSRQILSQLLDDEDIRHEPYEIPEEILACV